MYEQSLLREWRGREIIRALCTGAFLFSITLGLHGFDHLQTSTTTHQTQDTHTNTTNAKTQGAWTHKVHIGLHTNLQTARLKSEPHYVIVIFYWANVLPGTIVQDKDKGVTTNPDFGVTKA